MTDFFPSSEKAKQVRECGQAKYPWKSAILGNSFAVEKGTVQMTTLRSLASKHGKRLGFKFRVIEHDDCYEIARIK